MSKIKDAFNNKKAFIPFITGGDPSIDVTKELLLAMQEAGADLIEIGIPFSDPIAEGPVIQEADERALAAGCTTDKLMDMVESSERSAAGSGCVHDIYESHLCLRYGAFYETCGGVRHLRCDRTGCPV